MKRSMRTVLLACASAICVLNQSHAQLVVPHLVGVRFADRQHGWTAGADGLYYTQNGGNTWERQRARVSKLQPTEAPTPSNFGIALHSGQITWASQSTAIVLSDRGYLTGSVSGVWTEHDRPQGLAPGDPIYFTDLLNGWAMSRTTVYRTQDGGQRWTATSPRSWPQRMGPGFLPLSEQEVWIGGEYGRLAHTRDGGKTWAFRQLADMDGGAAAFDFVGPYGWILGSTGTRNCLFATEDGGRHWRRRAIPPDLPLLAMSFADQREGWVVGLADKDGEAVILHTSDGGRSWKRQGGGIKEFLLGAQALSNGEAWAVGHKGTLLHTTDHGETWHRVRVP